MIMLDEMNIEEELGVEFPRPPGVVKVKGM